MLTILFWYLCGLVGFLLILYSETDTLNTREITLGDIIYFVITPALGPVIPIMLIAAYFCADERPKWESKVVYKRKD